MKNANFNIKCQQKTEEMFLSSMAKSMYWYFINYSLKTKQNIKISIDEWEKKMKKQFTIRETTDYI